MRGLKIKYLIEKHRRKGILLVGIIIVIIVVQIIECVNWDSWKEDSVTVGVLGTLLGAIIGGTFSLLGSVWVNKKQQKAAHDIKIKNVIYSPLYDELVNIQDIVLRQNPYPEKILFQRDSHAMDSYVQYDAWRRIRSDTRYLEVPLYLKKQMEKLENVILQYAAMRDKVNAEIEKIGNEIFVENKLAQWEMKYIGYYTYSKILDESKVDICKQVSSICGDNNLTPFILNKINDEIFQRCNSDTIICDTRKYYSEWKTVQKETIDMLSLLIKKVLLKYEV